MQKSVYVMKSGSLFKIGVAANPEARLISLRTGSPKIELVYKSKMVSNAYSVEGKLHQIFKAFCIGGEWFAVPSESELIESVCTVVNEIGVEGDSADGKQSKKSIQNMVDFALRDKFDRLEVLTKENKKIEEENKKLAEELAHFGWSDDEIASIISEAIKTVS